MVRSGMAGWGGSGGAIAVGLEGLVCRGWRAVGMVQRMKKGVG
jgi:hypothetical protein